MPEGGIFEIEILTFNGKSLASQVYSNMPAIPPTNNTIFNVTFQNRFTIDKGKAYVRLRYIPRDSVTVDDQYYNYMFYDKPKLLNLPIPDIKIDFNFTTNSMTFKTHSFAMYVYVYLCGEVNTQLRLSENYFHLSAGWPVNVAILSNDRLGDIKDDICLKTV